jgi:hypothetical protein
MTTPIFGLWIEQGLNTVTRSALAESPVCSTSFCDDIGGLSPVLVPALQAGLPTGPKRKTPDPRRTLASHTDSDVGVIASLDLLKLFMGARGSFSVPIHSVLPKRI